MTLERIETIDIHEIFHEVAEESLQLVRLPIKRDSSWIEIQVKALESNSGDIDSLFFVDKKQQLFHIEKELIKPENKELAKRWNIATALHKKISMQLIEIKMLKTLENWESGERNPTGDALAFAKTIYAMTKASDKDDRPADERETEYEEVEKNMEREDD